VAPTASPTATPPNWINEFDTIQLPINFALLDPYEFGIAGRGLYDYYWIWIVAILAAFVTSMGIGANDVANTFATSVGSKTLKMWQAVLLAGLMEFLGAVLLGGRVTDTIRKGIVDIATFENHDDLLMAGMMSAIFVVGIWLFLATYLELPVSTTHSTIGAIVGFGLCSPGGAAAVNWTNIGLIAASWVVAPLISCTISAVGFFLIRYFILRSDNSFQRAFLFFPILVFITVLLNVIFIMFKGKINKGKGVGNTRTFTDGEVVGISFGVAAGVALIVALLINPRLKRYIDSMSEEDLLLMAAAKGNIALSEEEQAKAAQLAAEEKKAAVEDADGKIEDGEIAMPRSQIRQPGKVEAFFDKVFSQDKVHAAPHTNERVGGIHEQAERFPLKTEFALGYLQVFTAMFASFAHGANDVANAIGPLAAVNNVYFNGVGAAVKKSEVPDWILVMGGAGISIGLALYGHVIIAAMGVKLVKITPARGFIAELSTALVIIIGTFLGLPLSSTQIATGAIIGLGLIEGNVTKSVNWRLFAKVFSGWVATLIVAGSLTAMVFSFITFAPTQIYPLSMHNCLNFYGVIEGNGPQNVSRGDPSTYTQTVQDGTIKGFYGYPSNGTIILNL